MAAREPNLLDVCRRSCIQPFLVIQILSILVCRDLFVQCQIPLVSRIVVVLDVMMTYGVDSGADDACRGSLELVLKLRIDCQMPRVAPEFLWRVPHFSIDKLGLGELRYYSQL